MKNKKLISGFLKVLIYSLLAISLNAGAQSTNQDQNNNTGTTNQQNNNINNPYTTVPADSVNHPNRYNGNIQRPHAPQSDVQQQQKQILKQSGQSQVIVPPNPSGPDTNVHRITGNGNFTNSASDTSLRRNNRRGSADSIRTNRSIIRDTLK